ncbi:MAG: phage holin family protein [Armatimonadota bacterium]|nr:phage holin family protein [Armatimonadota bacterium]
MSEVGRESTSAILRRLAGNVAALLQTYALLTGAEARASIRDVMSGLLLRAVAGLLAVVALGLAVVTAVLLLSLVLQPWEAAAVVFASSGMVMVLCAGIGLARLRRRRLRKVVDAFKEDLRWLRRQLLESD